MTNAASTVGVPDPATAGRVVYPIELVATLPPVSWWSRSMMRGVDLLGATVSLVVFSPVFLVVSVLVKVDSRGPVIFRQERVGRGGNHFVVLKFRTMEDGTHELVQSDPHLRRQYEDNDFKLPANDPRITKVGRRLRKTSLDELPQLLNVLRGEMALVGVRPLKPEELALRNRSDRALYCLHRPALTGLWQVQGRSAIGGVHRIELDRECLTKWGLRHNIKLLARTPAVVLRRLGAH